MKITNLDKKQQLNALNLRQFPYRINWEITQNCNFACEYCINPDVNLVPPPPIFSPEELKHHFDRTNKSWLILITGGEPFLYPDFVKVCKVLTEKHHLQITSNISTANVIDFANQIDPNRVFNISASWHKAERHKRNLQQDFEKKCLYLKEKGFNIIVNLIAYPQFIDEIENDIQHFHDLGLDTMVFGFRGIYEGKHYPYDYPENEKALLKKYAIDDTEYKIATQEMDFFGRYCDAGRSYFSMKHNGDIGRCFSLSKKISNFFEDGIKFQEKLTPCISHNCIDCYNGVAAVREEKASYLKLRKAIKHYKKLDN